MTAPATGRGAHFGLGGTVSTGQTGPAVTVPDTLGGGPAGATIGEAPGLVIGVGLPGEALGEASGDRAGELPGDPAGATADDWPGSGDARLTDAVGSGDAPPADVQAATRRTPAATRSSLTAFTHLRRWTGSVGCMGP